VFFLQLLRLSAPLFGLVLLGAVIAAVLPWRRAWTTWINRFVFAVPLPVLLFRAVSRVGGETNADPRLLLAFFGSCFLVFGVGWLVARGALRVSKADSALVGIASVFSNNGLLGVPLVQVLLGPSAMPAVAWVMMFNAITLWTLVTLAVESARQGEANWKNVRTTLLKVASSPIVIGIGCGVIAAVTGFSVPSPFGSLLDYVSAAAGPLALVALGLDVAHYDVRQGWRTALVICVMKLLLQPFIAWGLCTLLGLPLLESRVVVLMSSLSVGVNVHLMAQHFDAQQSAIASALVLSTLLGAITTPLLLTLPF
jgi:malonate transporter and related proteins